MAVDVTHLLRSCCRVCLLLSFSHTIGLLVSPDVNRVFSNAVRSHQVLPVAAVSTLSYDVTRNAVLRPITASDDVVKAAANGTRRHRWRRKAEMHDLFVSGDYANRPETARSRELAAQTLQELEQELDDARVNCSGSSGAVQTLNVELPARILGRFSAEASSVVHAANVVSLLLQSPAEMTSRGDAFYFSFARAVVESASDWVHAATLIVERPAHATIGPRAERFLLRSSALLDVFGVRGSDVGDAEWYTGLLQRGGRKAARCGRERWTTRNGDIVNKSTVVSELADVVWSVPYVQCPSQALLSLVVPIYSCGQQHNVVIRSASHF